MDGGDRVMAVPTEGIARWSRGFVELDDSHVNRKKRAWGEDALRVVQLMMGHLRSEDDHQYVALDLLGKSPSELKCNNDSNWGFLELDPDQPRLPCGWEKCLDIKTGKMFFVEKQSIVRTSGDSWKHQNRRAVEPLLAHEFLCSKESETLREEEAASMRSTSSSEAADATNDPRRHTNFLTSRKLQQLRSKSKFANLEEEEEEAASCNLLKMDLNLAVEGSGCSSSSQTQPGHPSVCTMEMVHDAIKRNYGRNHKFLSSRPRKQSGSSSVSSLTSIQSEHTSCFRQASPSTCTSSSSSTSLRSSSLLQAHPRTSLSLDDSQSLRPASSYEAGEAESKAVSGDVGALVMGACTMCLMYVILEKSDPTCPRCESTVPFDFSSPPTKRPRTVVHHNSFGSNISMHAVM